MGKQLLLFGLEHAFSEMCCAVIEQGKFPVSRICAEPAVLLGIYSRVGHYGEEDNVPSEVMGCDCPFDDSKVVYACCADHLARSISMRETLPDVCVDPTGALRLDEYRQFGELLGYINIHLCKGSMFFGREPCEQFLGTRIAVCYAGT